MKFLMHFNISVTHTCMRFFSNLFDVCDTSQIIPIYLIMRNIWDTHITNYSNVSPNAIYNFNRVILLYIYYRHISLIILCLEIFK